MLDLVIGIFSNVAPKCIKKLWDRLHRKYIAKNEELLTASISGTIVTICNNSLNTLYEVKISSDDFWSLTPAYYKQIDKEKAIITNIYKITDSSNTPSININWLDKHNNPHKVNIRVYPKV